ncbi:MAG: hypothetical protein QOI41_2553 [Myxococcales bacterium]|nr:hypothetical protein [Myxococcales bacterium]
MNGYTKESGGKTGYITAIDMDSGEVMWRSAPQVANTKTSGMTPRGSFARSTSSRRTELLAATERAGIADGRDLDAGEGA